MEASDLEREIEAARQKLMELERKKAELPIEALVNKFYKTTGKINVTLSRYHREAVDNVFRRIPGRVFSGDTNTLPATEVLGVLERLQSLGIIIKWDEETKTNFDAWINQPDIVAVADVRLSKIRVDLGPKMVGQRLYIGNDIQSWQYQYVTKNYEMALMEAYKLPTCLEKYYPQAKIEYDDKLKEVIFQQVERKRLVAEIATATDWDIKNPFTQINPDTGEKYDLKPIQRVAVKFAEVTGGKCLTALPMGAGKTAIAVAYSEIMEFKKVLIICPAPAKTNWKNEIKKFTGKEAFILYGATPDGACIDSIMHNKYQYYIINYDIIARAMLEDKDTNISINKWAMVLNLGQFDFIVPDEAHRIKNTSSKRSQAVRSLVSPHWDPLTGTPIVNRPKELFPLLQLLDPVTFNNETLFEGQYTDSNGNAKNVAQLHEILARYMFRRTSEQIFGESLEPNRIPYNKELSPQARLNYQRVLEGVYVSLRNPQYQRNVTSILAELTRCKQICSADNCETSADLAITAIEETDKKVLIFSQFKESQGTINGILGSSAAIINGDVNDERRYELIAKFQDPKSDLKFLVTNILEALTLTAAHTVIFNDIWWTPKDHAQAEGRAFGRVNDPHAGNAYYIQNENTIDEFLVALLQKKLAIFKEVIDGVPQAQETQMSLAMELINHLRQSMA